MRTPEMVAACGSSIESQCGPLPEEWHRLVVLPSVHFAPSSSPPFRFIVAPTVASIVCGGGDGLGGKGSGGGAGGSDGDGDADGGSAGGDGGGESTPTRRMASVASVSAIVCTTGGARRSKGGAVHSTLVRPTAVTSHASPHTETSVCSRENPLPSIVSVVPPATETAGGVTASSVRAFPSTVGSAGTPSAAPHDGEKRDTVCVPESGGGAMHAIVSAVTDCGMTLHRTDAPM